MNLAGGVCRHLCRQRHIYKGFTAAIPQSLELYYEGRLLCPTTSTNLSNRRNGSNMKYVKKMVGPVLKVFGHQGFTLHPKHRLDTAGLRLYISCTEYTDFELFKDKCNVEDTFSSWVALVQLHVWMLMQRIVQINPEGALHTDFRFLTIRLIVNMWRDIEARIKLLAKGSARKKGRIALVDQFKTAMLLYDEGYLSDDKVLATALWRTVLNKNEKAHPEELYRLVEYVHKNLNHLESMPDDQLLKGFVTFLPYDSDKPNVEMNNRIHEIVSKI